MRFSECYNITGSQSADWFDPILFHDTQLFIDPFLIFKANHPYFLKGHSEIIRFFNTAFKIAARSRGIRRSLSYKKLENILLFPEVSELCLGYTEKGVKGSGSGNIFSRVISAGILESISAGLTEVTHFEEIGLLHEGIGPDRISDITANILKSNLISYTQNICKDLGVPLQKFYVRHIAFDYDYLRWSSDTVRLPLNQYYGKPILLVPRGFLRCLPTISPDGFLAFLWDYKGDQIRHDLNYEIKAKVKKSDIIRLAKRSRFLVREYLEYTEGRATPIPYDLIDDPKFLYKWWPVTQRFVDTNPLVLSATTTTEFLNAIERMVLQYKHFVESNRGFELLWDDDQKRPKRERAAQLLFLGMVKNHCVANNIDVSRETNIGRGPVDFKFSSGYESRVLLEVKLAKNTKFWRNIENQLPAYLEAEEIKHGFYLVIAYTESDLKKLTDIERIIKRVSKKTNRSLRIFIVSALQDKVSASRL